MGRIRWTEERACSRGSVGSLELFVISWNSTRGEPRRVMQSKLAGDGQHFLKDDDEDILKERAERILEAYVRELGAVFPDSSEEGSR